MTEFLEIRLPTGVQYSSSGGPAYNTSVYETFSGYERRNQNWSAPRRRWDVRMPIKNQADYAPIRAFFNIVKGRAIGFRFKDPFDHTSKTDGVTAGSPTDQPLGTGNGSQTQFQLIKNYTYNSQTYTRTITKPRPGTLSVAFDGVQQTTGFSVDTTTGVVTFSPAPSNGVIITAGFEFETPVRFDNDVMEEVYLDANAREVAFSLVELRL